MYIYNKAFFSPNTNCDTNQVSATYFYESGSCLMATCEGQCLGWKLVFKKVRYILKVIVIVRRTGDGAALRVPL